MENRCCCNLSINTASKSLFVPTDNGIGFGTAPTGATAAPAGVVSDRAIGIASIGDAGNGFNRVNSIFVQNAGIDIPLPYLL